MQTIFRLPESFRDDLDHFREQTDRFRKGSVSAAEYRSFRVPRGVYEQRESDTYMLRVRLPAGIVLPEQMRALARVARRYGNGVLHATTRQDIQVHRVLLENLHPALADLYAAGLSTRGGGGNTVRNITGCPDAGVCPREAFDVSAHVVALTEFLIPDPLSYQLPRKYKIAVSGCPRDCAGATVNDLGFIARRNNGSLGFAVCVGGGMGASSRIADRFEEFVPAGEIHLVAEAVKRVFDQHGNRRNRQRARLRFLIEQIGLARFRELYEMELAALRASGACPLAPREWGPAARPSSFAAFRPEAGFAEWHAKHVTPQKQADYFIVRVPLTLGDIDAGRLERLADLAHRYGEGIARTTQQQNLALRWVHRDELPALHSGLSELGLAGRQPPILSNLVACAGASTCRLGICLSRGLAKAVLDALGTSPLDLDAIGDLRINISGCPNSCGRHATADIGLFGAARRVRGRLVPHYVPQLGGRVGEGESRFGRQSQAIPARNVPAFLVALLDAFRGSPQHPDFARFLEAEEGKPVEALVRKHQQVPDYTENKDYYFDWGASEAFSLAGRGPGECGAGVFDLIELDLANAQSALTQGRLFEATVLAARSLLVTRGQQARDAAESIELFTKFFIDEKLVDDSCAPLAAQARQAAGAPDPEDVFTPQPQSVAQLVAAVQKLYEGMDASLRFKPVGREAAVQQPPQAQSLAADSEADFRGVTCPLNYVKTKLLLDRMARGKVLSVLLDDPGARNVPPSVEKDGHQVLSLAQEGDHWRVVIRRG